MNFEMVTDTSSNLVDDVIDRFGIHVLPLQFTIDGVAHQSYLKGEKSDLKRFYTMMRAGKTISTSLPILSASEETLRAILDRGSDLLYLGSPRHCPAPSRQPPCCSTGLHGNTPNARFSTSTRWPLRAERGFWCTKPPS